MRLTKFIEHFKLAAVASDAKTADPLVKYLAVGRQLGYAFYMLLDNLTYPDVAGIRKFAGAARLQKEAYRAWLVGLTCNVVAGVYALYNLRVAAKKQEDSADAEKAVEVKKLAKYVLGVPIYSSWKGILTHAKQGQKRCSAPAHLRPVRYHRSQQRSRSPQPRRRHCRSCRHPQQLDRPLRRVAEDCLEKSEATDRGFCPFDSMQTRGGIRSTRPSHSPYTNTRYIQTRLQRTRVPLVLL